MRDSSHPSPVRVALIDDYEVVVRGLATLLADFPERVEVVELDTGPTATRHPVDVMLYDTFAQPRGDAFDWQMVSALLERAQCPNLLVYSWHVDEEMVIASHAAGARGCVGKHLTGEQLVTALERAAAGQEVFVRGRTDTVEEGDWPGRTQGLTERESEVVSLIVQGLSNEDIAHCTFLGHSTVKTYIRQAYRKMGVASRTQAVLWGIKHGFTPDHRHLHIAMQRHPA